MQPHDEELLSAFHDGELHGDDRRAIERMLDESAGAREAVEEFAEIRTALKALPRTVAPADLQPAVMRQLRTSQPVAAPPQRRRHPSLRWIVSTAACVTIVVGVYSLSEFVGPAEQNERVATMDAPAAHMRQPDAFAAGDPVAMEAAMPGPPRGAAPDAALAMNAPAFEAVDRERLQSLIAEGTIPLPGEMIIDFREIDDQLMLIEYSVVDVHEQLFGQVEVILERCGIKRLAQSGEFGEPVAQPSGEMFGIYVDAPSEQFDKAVAELGLVDGIVAVSAAAPAEEAANMLNRSRLQSEPGVADRAAAAAPEAPPSSARNTRRDAQPPGAEVQAADAAPAESAPLAGDAAAGQPPAQSLQLRVPLRSELLSELQEEQAQSDRALQQRQSLDPAQLDPAQFDPAQRDRSHEPAAAPTDTDAPSPERVRVILVFVRSPDP